MARQRFIHPTIWKDPMFGRLQPLEQLMFIGMFSIADDEGRLLADPAYLRAEIFPYKDYTAKKVKTIRDSVVEQLDNVNLYTAPVIEYIALLKWGDFQKPKYPTPSKIPPPLGEDFPNPSLESRPVDKSSDPRVGLGLGRDGFDSALGLGLEDEKREELVDKPLRRVV